MKKKVCVILITLCVLILAAPLSANGESVKLFYIGTVIGEAGVPYYFYSSPEKTEENILGYYYAGVQLKLLEIGPEWCHFSLGFNGYIQTSCLSISQNPGQIEQIGFAFATFSPDDPAVQSTDNVLFIPFLGDCNVNQTTGDPLSVGRPLRLIGYCGDMIQAKRYGVNGFLQKKHANILMYDDLFPQTLTSVAAGTYLAGEALPAGLYHAATNGSSDAEIIVSDDEGKRLAYTVKNIANTIYTIYIPIGATVTVSPHGVLTSVLSAPVQNQPVYSGGRLLSGVDADFEWLSGWQYSVCAADTQDAYYIISTPWNDKMLEAGETYPLAPGETKRINLDAGESIELYNCWLEGEEY